MLTILLLSSCATITSWIEGVPRWTIRTPGATLTTISYVGRGEGQDMDQARTAAVDDLLQQIAQYIGYRLDESHRSELLASDRIADIGLFIEDTYSEQQNGEVVYYLLAEANRRTINDARRSWEDRGARQGQEYIGLADAARRAYSRNQDMDAFFLYLEAAATALRSPATEYLRLTREYLDQARDVLTGIRIETLQRSSGDRTFQVRVTRDGRTFSGSVAGAPLTISYTVYNASGRQTSLVEPLKANTRGIAEKHITHTGFRGTGRVVFALDLSRGEQLLQELQEHPETEGRARQLLRLGSEKQAAFSYSVRSSILGGNAAAGIIEYDRGGVLRDAQTAQDALIATFNRDGIETITLDHGGSEEEALRLLQHSSQSTQTGIIGSVEIVSVISSGNRHIATARGSLEVIESRTLQRKGDTDVVVANGTASTVDAAKRAALIRFGEIAAGVLLNAP